MTYDINCYKCDKTISASSLKLSFAEECHNCKTDLHACKQCRFYDSNAYNNCSEPQAERVLDKERRNYCEYFESKTSLNSKTNNDDNSALKKLEDLFK